MISVAIWRKTLVRLGACADGLAAFDAVCALQPADDPRRAKRLRIPRWTPLHAIWIRAQYPAFASWLEARDLIPRANLSGADLRSANLYGADLRSADLYGANLSGANLSGADLSGADLRGADLGGADLRGANLSGANIYDANISGADLSGANLRGACLYCANLRGANLSGARRYSYDLPIPGWHCTPEGVLVRIVRDGGAS